MSEAEENHFVFDPLNNTWLKKTRMKAYPNQFMWVGQDPIKVPAVVKAMALLLPTN